MRLKKTAVMVGMMGAGKTAVGTALARILGVPFRDSDEEIVRAANRSIAEIFERDGEPFFRARETEVITRQAPAKQAANDSKNGTCASSCNRINFALGSESLDHTDFSLPGRRDLMVCALEIVATRGSGGCRLAQPGDPDLATIGDARDVVNVMRIYRRGELIWRGPGVYR